MNLTGKLYSLFKLLNIWGYLVVAVNIFYFTNFTYTIAFVFFIAYLLSLTAYVISFSRSKKCSSHYLIDEHKNNEALKFKFKYIFIIIIAATLFYLLIFKLEPSGGHETNKMIIQVILLAFSLIQIAMDRFHKTYKESILIHDEGIMVNLLHINFLTWEAISYIELNEYEQSVFIHRPIGDTLQFNTKKTDFNSIASHLKSHLPSNRVLQKQTHQQLH